MSDRRAARASSSATGRPRYVGNTLPPEMAIGPCIEEWADQGTAPGTSRPDHRARRNWAAAVDEWAESTGWAREGRPAMNARNLARTRQVWSRVFLIEQGRAELVDYYEGRRDKHPGRTDDRWNPSH